MSAVVTAISEAYGKQGEEPKKVGVFRACIKKYRTAMDLHEGFIPTQELIDKEGKEAKQLSYLGGGTLALLVLAGSATTLNGLTLAILTSAGIAMLIIKMPAWFRHLMVEFDLAADILITLIMFGCYGATVTGVIGSGMTCILASVCFKLNRYYVYKELRDGKK